MNSHHLQMQTVQKLHPPMKNQTRLGVRMMRKCDEQKNSNSNFLQLIRPKLLASWGIVHIIIIQIQTFKHQTEISDHENIGIDTLIMAIACTDIDIDFSVMGALIKRFRVQSHACTPQTCQQHFFMMRGVNHTKKLDPYMWPFNLLGSWTNVTTCFMTTSRVIIDLLKNAS